MMNSSVSDSFLDNSPASTTPTNVTSSTSATPPSGAGAVVTAIFLTLLGLTCVVICVVYVKRSQAKKRRRERRYTASVRSATFEVGQTAEEAIDADENDNKTRDDDDVMIDRVHHVFANPPQKDRETGVTRTDRLWHWVGHMFGSHVPLGAARVRTVTGDTLPVAPEKPIVLNGRIQALYDEIMKQDASTQAAAYGVLQEELTPDAQRRRSVRRASARPASQLSAVSEVSLELMDSGTISGTNASGFDQSHLDVILQKSVEDGDGLFSGGLADELEASLPVSTLGTLGASATSLDKVAPLDLRETSTGFIANQQDPQKYYSIAYTEYYLDD